MLIDLAYHRGEVKKQEPHLLDQFEGKQIIRKETNNTRRLGQQLQKLQQCKHLLK